MNLTTNTTRVLISLIATFWCLTVEAQSNYFYSAEKVDSAQNRTYVLFTSTGERVFDFESDWIIVSTYGFVFCQNNNLIKVYDTSGNYLNIDSIEETNYSWTASNLIPLKKNGYWGYYSKDGQLKIAHKYQEATMFTDGKAAVKIAGKSYFIDSSGKILKQKYVYSEKYSFESFVTAAGITGFADRPQEIFKRDEKLGLIEKSTRKVLIEPVYDGIFSITEENVVVLLNGKYGVVNFNGKVVIPIVYNRINLWK